VEYTDGSGGFVMQGAGVVREDLTEHSRDNMLFQVLKHLPVFSGGNQNHIYCKQLPAGSCLFFRSRVSAPAACIQTYCRDYRQQ
jgi:hypothetical protein